MSDEQRKENELNDWIDGQIDCRKGVPAKPDKSEAYQKGYGFQYELDEMIAEMSRWAAR